MFDKATYVNRRAKLKELVKSGIIILFGNNESPCNFPANGYYPFRQDSSFLYYFGLNRDGLVGVIDIDNDIETLVGNDIDKLRGDPCQGNPASRRVHGSAGPRRFEHLSRQLRLLPRRPGQPGSR